NSGFNEGLLPPSKTQGAPDSGPVSPKSNEGGSGALRGWRGAQMEADGTLVCFDTVTGKHLWKMQLPTAVSGIISGDVDGDGEADLILGGQDGNLLAVRDAGDRGEVIWRKTFDAPIGASILADVNGD